MEEEIIRNPEDIQENYENKRVGEEGKSFVEKNSDLNKEGVEQVEDSQLKKDPSKSKSEQESLRREIDSANQIGMRFIKIGRHREANLFFPLFDIKNAREIFPVNPPENQDVTTEDLKKAEKNAVLLTLEVANQILGPKDRVRVVSDDPESLMQVYKILTIGDELLEVMKKQKGEEAKSILENALKRYERYGVKNIHQLSSTILSARDSIRRKIEIIKRYSQRTY